MYDSIDLLTSARDHFLTKLQTTKIMHFGVRFHSRNKHNNEKGYFQVDMALVCCVLSCKSYNFVTKLANSALDRREFQQFATSKRFNTEIINIYSATKKVLKTIHFSPSSGPCLDTRQHKMQV